MASVLAALLSVARPAAAASLSGILLYATHDDFGNPNGEKSFDGEFEAQAWRTAPSDKWYGLGVWSGLPPTSVRLAPINGPDFMIEFPLSEGENDFTLLGQPAEGTRGDTYWGFAINLYFDGVLDRPGVSVVFPRHASPDGSPTTASNANRDQIYALSLAQASVDPKSLAAYDDGVVHVSVIAACFLPPEEFGADFDLVQAHRLAASDSRDPNGADFVGVLKIMVESSTGGGGPAIGPAAGGFGAVPGAPDGRTLHGPDLPIGQPGIAAPGFGGPGDEAAPGHEVRPQWQAGRATAAVAPTIAAAEERSPEETPSSEETPTPALTTTPAARRTTTPSPATTPAGSPATTPQRSPTVPTTPGGATSTPAAAKTESVAPGATPTPINH